VQTCNAQKLNDSIPDVGHDLYLVLDHIGNHVMRSVVFHVSSFSASTVREVVGAGSVNGFKRGVDKGAIGGFFLV